MKVKASIWLNADKKPYKSLQKAFCIIMAFALTVGVANQIAFAGLDTELLKQPYNLKVEQMADDEENPYGGVKLLVNIDNLPVDVEDSSGSQIYGVEFEQKIGDTGAWANIGGFLASEGVEGFYLESTGLYKYTYTWSEDLSNVSVSYRARMAINDYGEAGVPYVATSPWSNIATIGFKSSAWAIPWLEKAESYNLIPDTLKGKDMTQPITRAEFAALSVKLYEALSGKTAIPALTNPFTDTTDPEILKAVNIGVTNGTTATTFTPNDLITREQAATMLTRAYKAVFWEGWTLAGDAAYTAHTLDFAGVAAFADDASISAYAKPSVYFMVKNGIINGVGNNMFAPNTSNIPLNAALYYGQATREAATKIAVASFENLK